tara:strand:+ start:44 stop:502 length:459 start_codon:yes stop_codon:yes gene_type:complete
MTITNEDNNSNWGGARKGAGRKKGSLNLKISNEIKGYCEEFIIKLLSNELIKNKAEKQIKKNKKNIKEFVYVVKSGGLTKIGYTTNFEKRYSHYLIHNPSLKILLLREHKQAFLIETNLHSKYNKKRKTSEWFRLTNKEIIEALNIINNYCL